MRVHNAMPQEKILPTAMTPLFNESWTSKRGGRYAGAEREIVGLAF
jgi:hypothetical protein